jgi:hypothetical protein
MMAEEEIPPVSNESKGKKSRKGRKKKRKSKRARLSQEKSATGRLGFPKHAPLKCLRIPQAILEQNAGKECTDKEAAGFAGVKWTGPIGVEISSALKYGLLERPAPGTVKPTDLTRKIIRPQSPSDQIDATREAVLRAPVVSDVYKHYRGENLPDLTFFANTVRDSFKVPPEHVQAFVSVFIEALEEAKLLEDVGGKKRILDVTHMAEVEGTSASAIADQHFKKVSKGVSVQSTDTCFVMMPFANPLGSYYPSIYQPAIKKAGLTAIRADTDIFGTGKIIDQIWSGINSARVLVAELTGRNPNVLYELGLAHALQKPVVLVSSNEQDVPFDVRHVRVIYYDVTDPFWGDKLIDKVAENIVSALKNPKEAVLFAD